MRFALVWLSTLALSSALVVQRPVILYSNISPKLKIQFDEPILKDVLENDISLSFTPTLKPSSYNISISSDAVLTLALNPNKKWASPSTSDGLTLFLRELWISGENKLGPDEVAAVATVIPPPTIDRGDDNIIYMTGSSKLVINGSNFREKGLKLLFDPPLVEGEDYIVNVRSENTMVLTRKTSSAWRSDPGPLKLRRIDTGGGMLRVDPKFGGITVAEVQADLGAHGVQVESTSSQKLYQTGGDLTIIGQGFNSTSNVLRFSNGLRGRGVNYTAVDSSTTRLKLQREANSKWRANPTNLPGPLVLLAVDAGAGFVPVGPTEAKKGRVVATIFEDPVINKRTKVLYQSHSHELWITGAGFTRQSYETKLFTDPPIDFDEDALMTVHNRTHIQITLYNNKKWYNGDIDSEQLLKVVAVDTGAGKFELPDGGVKVAKIKPDAEDHPSGVTIKRSNQGLYQTAALATLNIEGTGFTDKTKLTFVPRLAIDEDYTMKFESDTKLVLSLKKHKKWRYTGGALMVKSIDVGDGEIPVGSGKQGIQVADILQDPEVEESKRIMFASHTPRLIIRGSGFRLDGTELTLSPTPRVAYEIESLEQNEITLKLKEGRSWAEVEEGKFVYVYVQKVDTGAGEVIFDDEGVIVAKIESDLDDNHCDDSCEWALDGICDDGSGRGREWWDDDYGGLYDYDDDYYAYGYYYEYGDDQSLAPVCEEGTDCTDCGGPRTQDQIVTCDNSCQWANDGFCDDTRTTGLCDLGTDCRDCGPADQSNFTAFEDDTWWDDDGYFVVDDAEYFGGAGRGEENGYDSNGAGGMFLSFLEGMVYLVGGVVCGGGFYVALKWYKGQGPIALPTAEQEVQMKDRKSVPLTPDVHYT